MSWFAKKVFDGGGKDLKNYCKSYSYLHKFLNITKNFIKKIIEELKRNPSNRCTEKYCSPGSIPGTEKNTARSGSLPSRCLSDRCTRNTASRCNSINKILTFGMYDKIGGAEPRAQASSGTSVFGLFIYQTVCRKIAKIVSDAQGKPLDRSTLISAAGTSCRGSILIEFSVCMPVLIILLFYIHDLVKIKRYYSQTEFVGQQMANILQNIAKTRTVTCRDIKYAAALAYLTIYPGTTMYTVKSGDSCSWHTLGHQPRVYIHYVEGESNGKASTKWALWTRSQTGITPDTWNSGFISNSDNSIVSYASNVASSAIYPTLKTEEGKPKVIIEAQIRWNRGDQKDANGKVAGSAREVFGLYLVNPKRWATAAYFPSVVIFTPNRGFTKTKPPSE